MSAAQEFDPIRLFTCSKLHRPVSFMARVSDDCPLCESFRQRDCLEKESAQFSDNVVFYRNIVMEIGDLFGEAARTSDDGSVQESVLALKVPELVRDLIEHHRILRDAINEPSSSECRHIFGAENVCANCGFVRPLRKRRAVIHRRNPNPYRHRRTSSGTALFLAAIGGFVFGMMKSKGDR